MLSIKKPKARDYSKAELIFNSRCPKPSALESFSPSPKLKKLIKFYNEYTISLKRISRLLIQVKIEDKIISKHKLVTTLGSDSEIYNKLPDLIKLLSYDMTKKERQFYFLKLGSIDDLIDESDSKINKSVKYEYSKTAKVVKIIKNPYRKGTKSFTDFEKIEIGDTHKSMLKDKRPAYALKHGWTKGVIILEEI